MRSFTDRVRKKEPHMIFLVRGDDITGRKAWYYVQIKNLIKKVRFEVESKRGQLNLTEYGTILESAYGNDPPAEIREKMKTIYGYEDGG